MTFTPEDMKQIVAKSGRAWHSSHREKCSISQTNAELANQIFEEMLDMARSRCLEAESDSFDIEMSVPNKDIAMLLLWKLKGEGFLVAGISTDGRRHAVFHFGPRMSWTRKRLYFSIEDLIAIVILAAFLSLTITPLLINHFHWMTP